ncbi:MAG TPA: hypothetical protein VH281_10160 [Gaiellaceae bacterium]|jgi:hypothetical protein
MSRRSRNLGTLVLAGVVAGLAWAGVATAAPGPCADVMPLSDVSKGQLGTGWTVVSGNDPESFDAEVLGVAKNLVAPGRDVIIVEISGPTVDAGGGVWAGMSGSPVYIGGQLAGALAYGFSFGATNIAGLTPAGDMLHINGLPVGVRVPARIRLPRSVVRSIAAKIGAALPTVGGSLVRLKLPVSLSGVAAERYGKVRKLFKKYKSTFRLTSGATASLSLGGTIDDLVPGGNFAASLSYGDITLGGVGTTTYVCDGRALAFGHPMTLGGKTQLGAGSADALAIVPDPLGPFKLANITDPLGTLDQDRLAGIRAVDGEPPSIPVTTATSSLDSGLARVGETDVVMKDALPDLAFTHVFSNIDSVFDKIGAGSASYEWTISGKRADGDDWELHRTNMYISESDLSFESAFELFDELVQIATYPNEKVSVTGVDATIDVNEAVSDYELTKVLFCRGGVCRNVNGIAEIDSRPGRKLKFRAFLKPSDGSPVKTVNIPLTIPKSARAGATVLIGGGTGCIFQFGECGEPPATFDRVLSTLRNQKPNNVLAAQLFAGKNGRVRDHLDKVLDQVVSGSVQVPVFFPGQCCPPDVFGGGDGGEFFFRRAD